MTIPRFRSTRFPADITLTPEQEAIRDKMYAEEEERERQEQEDREEYETQALAKRVTYVLNLVNDHPLIKEFLNIKKENIFDKLLKIVLPAVITANPELEPEMIANEAKEIIAFFLQ